MSNSVVNAINSLTSNIGAQLEVGNVQTFSADASTSAVSVIGPCRVAVGGNFGGGTMILYAKRPDDVWVAVSSATFTTAEEAIYNFPPYAVNTLKTELTSSSGPDAWVWIQANRIF